MGPGSKPQPSASSTLVPRPSQPSLLGQAHALLMSGLRDGDEHVAPNGSGGGGAGGGGAGSSDFVTASGGSEGPEGAGGGATSGATKAHVGGPPQDLSR